MTRRERLAYSLLLALGVVALAMFYGFWFSPSNYPTNFTEGWHPVDLAIYGALTLVVSHRIFMDVYLWVIARRIEPLSASPEPEPGLDVAFITTFVPGAEGLDLLHRTLPAMLAADYPHDVWLLDEGDDPQARALCARLGVHYFTRKGRADYNMPAGHFTRRTKGGNHNAWYDAHGHAYDVVAQIDTDFVPRRDFLTQTLGHFRDRSIGWVGTPQIYGNTSNFIARGSAEQQYSFYGPVLRGLSARGMANMLGANHVVRVEALEGIGYYAGHLTEDLLTGMRLHAHGWRSVYVPLPLAVGEGPDSWKSYFNQQQRWAVGCIQILRTHTRDLVRGMPLSWRAMYVSLQQGYFSGAAAAIGIGLLMLYFFAGVQISRVPLLALLAWGTPLFVMRHVIRLWLQRFNVRPKEERGLQLVGSLLAIAAWPIYFFALVRVLRGQDLVFRVTPKGTVRRVRGGNRQLFAPHAMFAALNLACLVAALTTGRQSGVLMAWAAVNVVLLGGLWLLTDSLAALRFRAGERALPVLTTILAQRRPVDAAPATVVVAPTLGGPDLGGTVTTLPRPRRGDHDAAAASETA